MSLEPRYDVAIVGAGLAGLSLARHLLLETGKTVLLLERRAEVPPARQKVGESTVQLAGYYFSKVLDLEEHLWSRQVLKYNLRFYWQSFGRENRGLEDYSQSYIRPISNILSYQLDRNTFEAELARLNREHPRCRLLTGIDDLTLDLAEPGGAGDHRLRFTAGGVKREVAAGWMVDASGRNRLLARRRRMKRDNPIRHGATFFWVDGLLDVEKLTGRHRREVRLDPSRRKLGHTPFWLATNHFVGEGYWFWVIPLQGKTSLGLVYDRRVVPREEVATPAKLIDWICRRHPLFARDLPRREILDWGGFRDFSYDCAQTLSPGRWALTGEAGRFSDPLYSPGSDLIALYNTLIVDAIETADPGELAAKCRLYESLMRVFYAAYVPGYAAGYDLLGDPEAFYLKYGWELAIYFGFYVFPFINDLFTDRRFAVGYLRQLGRLGDLNRDLLALLSAFYQWKKEHLPPPPAPVLTDFTDLAPLARAAATFYEVGVTVEEARRVLAGQIENLEELARFIVAHVASRVVADESLLTSREYVSGIDLTDLRFEPREIRRRWESCREAGGDPYPWSFDPCVMRPFREAGIARPAAEEVLAVGS